MRDARANGARTSPQIIAKPRQNNRHMPQVRAEHLQLINSDSPIAVPALRIAVERATFTRERPVTDRTWREAKLGRPGNERDSTNIARHLTNRPHDLELKLR